MKLLRKLAIPIAILVFMPLLGIPVGILTGAIVGGIVGAVLGLIGSAPKALADHKIKAEIAARPEHKEPVKAAELLRYNGLLSEEQHDRIQSTVAEQIAAEAKKPSIEAANDLFQKGLITGEEHARILARISPAKAEVEPPAELARRKAEVEASAERARKKAEEEIAWQAKVQAESATQHAREREDAQAIKGSVNFAGWFLAAIVALVVVLGFMRT